MSTDPRKSIKRDDGWYSLDGGLSWLHPAPHAAQPAVSNSFTVQIGNEPSAAAVSPEAPEPNIPKGSGVQPPDGSTGRFRKRPVVIEAMQWDGTERGCQRLKARFPQLKTLAKGGYLDSPEVTHWKIGTLEGGHEVTAGDWIIQGVKGELYPCKADIFALTYEAVCASSAPATAGASENSGTCIENAVSDALPENMHRGVREALARLEGPAFDAFMDSPTRPIDHTDSMYSIAWKTWQAAWEAARSALALHSGEEI